MTWTWDQFSASLPTHVWQSFIDWWVPGAMMVGTLLIVLLYPIQHQLLCRFCKSYREMETSNEHDKQQTVLQHSVEATVLGVCFLPLTYLILSLNFEEQEMDRLGHIVGVTGVFMFCIIIMYLIELAMRFRYTRPLVVAHHLCAYANSLFPAFALSTANLKAASLLIYFTTFESLTFVGLVLYRLYPMHKYTPRVILTGMVVFGITRPLQLIWIIGSLAASWENLVVWHAVAQIVLAIIFTFLQVFSLSIHHNIYKKVIEMQQSKDRRKMPARSRTANMDDEDGSELDELDQSEDEFADFSEDQDDDGSSVRWEDAESVYDDYSGDESNSSDCGSGEHVV